MGVLEDGGTCLSDQFIGTYGRQIGSESQACTRAVAPVGMEVPRGNIAYHE